MTILKFRNNEYSFNYQIKDVADIIARVFPGCPISLGKRGEYEYNYRVSDYHVNFNKIHAQLPNFTCDYTVLRGTKELRAVLAQIGLDQDIFDARHYTRIKQIQYLHSTQQINDRFFWKVPRVARQPK